MTTTTIHADTIYLTDNGAAYCGDHLGATAAITGRDISGQPIIPITPAIAREMNAEMADVYGKPHLVMACEICRKPAPTS